MNLAFIDRKKQRDEHISDLLSTSEFVLELTSRQRQETTALRKRLLGEIAENKENLGQKAVAAHQREQSLRKALESSHQAVRDAEQAYSQACGESHAARAALDNAVNERINKLAASADPRVKKTIDWLDNLNDIVRGEIYYSNEVVRSWALGKNIVTPMSTVDRVAATRARIAALRAEASQLLFSDYEESAAPTLHKIRDETVTIIAPLAIRGLPVLDLDDPVLGVPGQ